MTNRELEADEKWKSLSYFELQSEKFILVEGDISRTRRSCAMPYRALEVSAELVLQKGPSLLGDDDLQFATASEEIDEEKKKKVELESSGSGESSSEESEGDALLRLLEKAKSSKADLATSSERKGKASGSRRRSSRFPFLDEKSSDKTSEEPDFTEMLKKMMASGSQESMGQQLNTLVQMEILRTQGQGEEVQQAENFGLRRRFTSEREPIFVRGGGQTSRSRKGHAGLQERQEANAEAPGPTHQALCERDRTANGSHRRVGLQVVRLHKEAGMGQASQSDARTLRGVRGIGAAFEGEDKVGRASTCSTPERNPSMLAGCWRLEDGVASPAPPRPGRETAVRG